MITETEVAAVELRFPSLRHTVLPDGTHRFSGILFVDGTFDFASREYTFYFNRDTPLAEIQDNYSVLIDVPTQALPQIYETGSRIPPFAEYHMYPGHLACAWGPLDQPAADTTLQQIFEIALEYFFDQAYHERHGIWPRGEFYHREEGILQNYYQLARRGVEKGEQCVNLLLRSRKGRQYLYEAATLKQIKGHQPCLCKSKDHFRRCHNEIFHALWHLQKYCWRVGLTQTATSDLSIWAKPEALEVSAPHSTQTSADIRPSRTPIILPLIKGLS